MDMGSSKKNSLPLQQAYFYPDHQYHNHGSSNTIEFDESDVWKSNDQISTYSEANVVINKKKSSSRTATAAMKVPSSRNIRANAEYSGGEGTGGGSRVAGGMASSLPVKIPDWSKIYLGRSKCGAAGEEEEELDEEDRLPPHEYVARQVARNRSVAYSVHEGVGRTLKGRDLRKVRNAIWKQTGFED